MDEIQFPASLRIWRLKPRNMLIGALAISIFAVFLNKSLSVYLGPFMAMAFLYLYFYGYTELVTGIIVVANDALGTILLGSISFPYLLLVMVLLRWVIQGKLRYANAGFMLVALIFLLKQYFLDYFDIRTVVYSVTFLLSLLVIPRNSDSLQRLFRGIIMAVVLISLHACLTGGVEFREMEGTEADIRRGILGVGIGDPNYSCYLLMIGLICLWNEKVLSKPWKIIFSAIILYAVMITLSTTGLLALLLITLLYIFVGKKRNKAVVALLLVALAVVGLFMVYINLPVQMRNPILDGYIVRMEEKLLQMREGDMVGATTNRTNIALRYIRLIFSGSLAKILFGGNVLNALNGVVAHNTYIDMLLQVGIIGTVIMLFWIVWKLIERIRSGADSENRNTIIILKVLSLFFSLALSLSQGSLWSLWFYFLMVI